MNNVPVKVNGDTYDASEHNPHHNELENVVLSVGDSLGGDDFQLARAIAAYVHGGNYYIDSGSANALVLSPIGIKKAPYAYFVGMKVRARPAFDSTGAAATVNVASLGPKSIKRSDGTTDPLASEITVLDDCGLTYDGTNFRLPYKALNLPPLYNSIACVHDTDTLYDMRFVAGKCRDKADTFDIVLSADMVKRADAVWAAGTGNGGRASAVSLSSGLTLHEFVISKLDGTTDAGYNTSLIATNLCSDASGYVK